MTKTELKEDLDLYFEAVVHHGSLTEGGRMNKYTNAAIAKVVHDLARRMNRVANKMAAAEHSTNELRTKMGELRDTADMALDWSDEIEEGK